MDVATIFALPWGQFVIFGLRICDVSLDTLRVLFSVRGARWAAAGLGFFQSLIWIFAVGNAIKHLDSPWHILGYAGGFATGTLVGILVEQRLAYGLAMVHIVSRHGGVELVQSVVQRQHLDDVARIVEKWDPDAFVTVEEPRILRGGSIVARTKMNIPWLWERGG